MAQLTKSETELKNEKILNALTDPFFKLISGKQITPTQIILLISVTMKFVEEVTFEGVLLSGIIKKEMVINLINKFIEKSSMSSEDKANMQMFVDHFIANTIEDILKIDYASYVKQGCKWLCGLCK